jgi:hypothetical protein
MAPTPATTDAGLASFMIALKREIKIAVPPPDPHSRVQPFSARLNRSIEKRSKTPRSGRQVCRAIVIFAPSISITFSEFGCPRPRVDVLVPEETISAEYFPNG